ncbi:MAG: beta-ketoacyl-[acyl-carrier-protein] synthase family protein [Planctomycetaceae bacterium]|nr:beta-ketoacyl-[acyl-carrier-protein] synthase family protein [Planctomycetaceae bacterium]
MFCFHDPNRPERDVLITGTGAVTSFGTNVDETWRAICSGQSAIRPLSAGDIDHFDQLRQMASLPLWGAPVDLPALKTTLECIPRPAHIPRSAYDAWQSEPLVTSVLVSALQAVRDAQLPLDSLSPDRLGCVVGTSKQGLRSAELEAAAIHGGVEGPSDRWWHAFQADAPARCVAGWLNARGYVSCPVAACATGVVSLIQAARAVHDGLCDVVLAGSADASLRASVLASFHRLRVLAARNPAHPDAVRHCKPFDQHRDGFAIGEGAGCLVLESRQHAERRGRTGVQLTAGGILCDPTGITQIQEDGGVVRELLLRTLNAVPGPLRDRPVDFVNLHGTGTRTNDSAEALGTAETMETLFPGVPLPLASGCKGAIGHLLGGAGSVESVITTLAIQSRQLPPTTGLCVTDPQFRLPFVPEGRSIDNPLQRALKLSLGFGGHLACLLFDRTA